MKPQDRMVRKKNGSSLVFYATCVDVYWITGKRALLKLNLT